MVFGSRMTERDTLPVKGWQRTLFDGLVLIPTPALSGSGFGFCSTISAGRLKHQTTSTPSRRESVVFNTQTECNLQV